MRIATLCALVLLLPLSWCASAKGIGDNMCRNGLFPSETSAFSLAKVTGQGPLHFLADSSGCPQQQGDACQQKPYVLPGDILIVSKSQSGFQCAYYPSRDGGTAGWVTQARIESLATDDQPALVKWTGAWTHGDDTLVVTAVGSQLRVRGKAWWPARHVSQSELPGGPHIGAVSASAAPTGNQVAFTDAECHVKATLLNDILVVSDDRNCGGMNVSFDGVYRKRTR